MARPELIDDVDEMLGDFPSLITEDGTLTQDQIRQINEQFKRIVQKLNGRISHGTGDYGHRGNIDEQYIDIFTPDVQNTAFYVPHNLGRVPHGYDVVWQEATGHVYCPIDDRAGWNDTTLVLYCDQRSRNMKIRVF